MKRLATRRYITILVSVSLLVLFLSNSGAVFRVGLQKGFHPSAPDSLAISGSDALGEVETESLAVIGADVWQAAGFTGEGVKVGVLDMGFDRYKELLGSDLPENVTVRSFVAGKDADGIGIVHGTAVAEIIHDIAPQAELFFAAYDTDVEENLAIDWLVAQGVDIISNSTASICDPMDGSGEIAMLVDQVVEKGILWVNSAGNHAKDHYRGSFSDRNKDGYHEFAPNDQYLEIIPPKGDILFCLNWESGKDSAGGSTVQDFDLYVLDGNGNVILRSQDRQIGAGSPPYEFLKYEFPDSGPYYVAFYTRERLVDVTPATFNFFAWGAKINYPVAERSVTTPGDAHRSLTVGAVYWSNDVLESYSSQGPTLDDRLKPDLVAPAGVSSAAYGETWKGTSASAPHVAGAAALVKQAYPAYTPDQITGFLKTRAKDLGDTGPDNQYGFGRLWLGAPPGQEAPPTATITLPPPSPTASETATQAPVPLTPSLAQPTLTLVSPTATQIGTSFLSANSSWLLPLGFLACVGVPGSLGIGGILVAVLYFTSRKFTPTLSYPARPINSGAEFRASLPGVHSGGAFARRANRGDLALPGVGPVGSPPQTAARGEAAGSSNLVLCPRCRRYNRPQARFCANCGMVLSRPQPAAPRVSSALQSGAQQRAAHQYPRFCRHCGGALRATSRFCPRCGRPL
jgi:subtilisin family serine protease